MEETILVAGASGHLGRQVVRVLAERGYRVRALVRRESVTFDEGVAVHIADVRGDIPHKAIRGATCLVSCLGAPIRLEDRVTKDSFERIDFEGNERLFEVAGRAGVERVVYVSLVNAHLFMESEYVRAHERAVSAARQSPMMQTIVRSTPLFSMFTPMVAEAKTTQRVRIIGDGSTRTNPISDGDLAIVVADAVRDQPHEVVAGGPETFARERIAEMACEAAGVPPRVVREPAWRALLTARLRRPFNRRLAEAYRFHALYNEVDAFGPETGTERLVDVFAKVAREVA